MPRSLNAALTRYCGVRGGCLAPQFGQKTASEITVAPQFTQYFIPRGARVAAVVVKRSALEDVADPRVLSA